MAEKLTKLELNLWEKALFYSMLIKRYGTVLTKSFNSKVLLSNI